MNWEQIVNKDLATELDRKGMSREDLTSLIGIPPVTICLLEGSENQRRLVSNQTKEAVFLALGRISFQHEAS